jgi:hypothetical protein
MAAQLDRIGFVAIGLGFRLYRELVDTDCIHYSITE